MSISISKCDKNLGRERVETAIIIHEFFFFCFFFLWITQMDRPVSCMNAVVRRRFSRLHSWIVTVCLCQVEEEGLSHKDFASNCGTLAESVTAMIDEDFVVLNSGIFRKVTGVFRALHELYLEKFSDEMSVLVDEIGDEVAQASRQALKQSKSDHGLHKNSLIGGSKSKGTTVHRSSVGGEWSSSSVGGERVSCRCIGSVGKC